MGFPHGAAAPFSAPDAVSDSEFLRERPKPSDRQLGLDLKERGMALALEAEREEWINAALFALRHFAMNRRDFKTEDFRAWYKQEPHDHHVWGALTNRACKQGIIAWTERYAPSTSPKTHGHPVKVWRCA